MVIINGSQEDQHADSPESSQAGIVDEVEDGDESPGFTSTPHDSPRVLIIKKPGDSLHAMPLHGLEGGGTQHSGLVRHVVGVLVEL